MNETERMIPELRTTRRFAITLSVLTVGALALAFAFGHQLEDPLSSSAGATAVLAVWCVVGAGAAIVAIIDAYIRPEGERLSLIATIAATVFGLLALVVVIGIVIGATGVVDEDEPAEARTEVARSA
jgi:hypothetical protein